MSDEEYIFNGYDHNSIETKWREKWLYDDLYKTPKLLDAHSEKFYSLYSYPYPSGAGLHVGHAEGMFANDIIARFYRMNGVSVSLPMGWDSFGLPAENYAIKTGIHPNDSTEEAIATFIDQINKLGISVDWEKEVGAHRENYYKWTQWFFTELYKHGLAYKDISSVNWCPNDQTVLANEQVVEGKCERCDAEVEQKDLAQWFFKITDYAERLGNDLDSVDWPEATKTQQRNWIGRSEGINIEYAVPLYDNVFLASGNLSKKKRLERVMGFIDKDLKVLNYIDLDVEKIEVEEDGTGLDNAIKKVNAYKGIITDMPIIGFDTSLYIDGEESDPTMVKRNALGQKDEKSLSQAEIADLMIEYYKQIAEKNRGEVNAYFVDFTAILLPNGEMKTFEAKREIKLISKEYGEVDEYFPINSVYHVGQTEKYYAELSDNEFEEWLKPFKKGLQKFLYLIVTVYTTRPDTNFGATFIALAPDGKFVEENLNNFPNKTQVEKYIKETESRSEIDRISEGKEKTGVDTGLVAVNNLTQRRMPIYVSDFVLGNVGTGSLVGVPAHDKRDFEFAKKMNLDIVRVVVGSDGDDSEITNIEQVQEEEGTMVNSDFLNGLEILEAKEKIKDFLEEKGWGRRVVNYKLRDWLISRQRYWGAPIPVIWKERRSADKVLMIHGIGANGVSNWQPWFFEQLRIKNEKLNINTEIFSPEFPNSNAPVLSEWLNRIKEYDLTDNSSIVAHSLGCFAALKFAEASKLKQLILVAPVGKGSDEYIKIMERYQFPKELFKFSDQDVDYKKVAENVEEIVLIFSTDDLYITEEIRNKYINGFKEFKNVEIKTLFNRKHFGSSSNCKELPELLEYFSDKQYRILDVEDLPVVLPRDVDFIPKGYSPLSRSKEYIKGVREKFGEQWTPEFDTMDTFVCSSWYFFRFVDPKNKEIFANSAEMNKWLPADLYMIGAEHIVLHLLYARFFTKFLQDTGKVEFSEPFQKMRHMGVILGPDNRKMSKRWGDVINPNDVVKGYGSDTLRLYEMFMGPLDQSKTWNDSSVQGVRRFLERIYRFNNKNIFKESNETEIAINKLIKKIGEDIVELKYNTGVSEYMKFMNLVEKFGISKENWEKFILVLAPYAPFLAEEMWSGFGNTISVHISKWPKYDKLKVIDEKVEIGVQILGKTRGSITIGAESSESDVAELVLKDEKLNRYLLNGYKKVIYIKGKIVNFIV